MYARNVELCDFTTLSVLRSVFRRSRLQDESYGKTIHTYNNRRTDKAQRINRETSYLDITYISKLEKVHIF